MVCYLSGVLRSIVLESKAGVLHPIRGYPTSTDRAYHPWMLDIHQRDATGGGTSIFLICPSSHVTVKLREIMASA